MARRNHLQNDDSPIRRDSRPRRIGAGILGVFLLFAGTSHLGFARREFALLVPDWVPRDKDDVVVQSGMAEIALGGALLTLPASRVRLAFQPLLVLWALWSTGSWREIRRRSRRSS